MGCESRTSIVVSLFFNPFMHYFFYFSSPLLHCIHVPLSAYSIFFFLLLSLQIYTLLLYLLPFSSCGHAISAYRSLSYLKVSGIQFFLQFLSWFYLFMSFQLFIWGTSQLFGFYIHRILLLFMCLLCVSILVYNTLSIKLFYIPLKCPSSTHVLSCCGIIHRFVWFFPISPVIFSSYVSILPRYLKLSTASSGFLFISIFLPPSLFLSSQRPYFSNILFYLLIPYSSCLYFHFIFSPYHYVIQKE